MDTPDENYPPAHIQSDSPPPDWAMVLFQEIIGQAVPVQQVGPSLQDILNQTGPLPPQTVVIGACDDGCHLLLDLADPHPGSLLLIGDRGAGKTQLLRTMMSSLGLLNTPRQARAALISTDTTSLAEAVALPNCIKAVPGYSDEAIRLVEGLVELAEQRRQGRQAGPAVLLLIDDLLALLNTLDDSFTGLLGWLAHRGPESRIWLAAALGSEAINRVDPALLRCFGAWLVGQVSLPAAAAFLACERSFPAEALIPGAQFRAWINDEWVKFWAPGLT